MIIVSSWALVLMSLTATLLPALAGMNHSLDLQDADVVKHSKRKPCANS